MSSASAPHRRAPRNPSRHISRSHGTLFPLAIIRSECVRYQPPLRGRPEFWRSLGKESLEEKISVTPCVGGCAARPRRPTLRGACRPKHSQRFRFRRCRRRRRWEYKNTSRAYRWDHLVSRTYNSYSKEFLWACVRKYVRTYAHTFAYMHSIAPKAFR